MIRFASVCSGIGAPEYAWRNLGWHPVFMSEIEAFPRTVLEHHYPGVPLHGDFTTITENDYGSVDLLVGGTPCQSFSIAGQRGGLDDERGNLSIEFVRLAKRLSARWLVWENVPGVLSQNKGRDFGTIIREMEKCGYRWAYRILDAQFFGVPQRRRRVFLIGYTGDWRNPAKILFERKGLRGDIEEGREKKKDITGTLNASFGSNSYGNDLDYAGGLIVEKKSKTLMAGSNKQDPEMETYVCSLGHTQSNGLGITLTATANTLEATSSCNQAIYPINTQVALRSNALGERTGFGVGKNGDPAFTLQASHHHAVADLSKSHVRRLTPRECERLQGFPDDYTLIDYRNKPASDGPRYKALGNSMAVPVMRWIGERISRLQEV